MTQNITIVKPAVRDFSEIFLLLKQLWPDKKFDRERTKKIFSDGLNDTNRTFLIAKKGEKTVGFVSLSIRGSLYDDGLLGNIDELVVDENYRSMGVGKKLLDEIIRVARRKSCKRVELDSAFRRKKAHHFYLSQGFEKCNFLFSKDI